MKRCIVRATIPEGQDCLGFIRFQVQSVLQRPKNNPAVELFVTDTWVRDNWQGKGLGSALLSCVERFALTIGAVAVAGTLAGQPGQGLWCKVFNQNNPFTHSITEWNEISDLATVRLAVSALFTNLKDLSHSTIGCRGS